MALSRYTDIAGQRFGRLIALKPSKRPNEKHCFWECRCDCGGSAEVRGRDLRAAHIRSCGCLNKGKGTTHGMTKRPLYRRWSNIRGRCINPKNTRYHDYGGRGITIAKEWDSFEAFRDWSLANGYSPELQIDRIDNDGPYAPDNCRWVDRETNANNTRTSQIFKFFGEQMSVSQASRKFGIPTTTLSTRLQFYGFSPEEAVTAPTDPRAARRYRKERQTA